MRQLRLIAAVSLASALPLSAFAQTASSPSTTSLIAEITALEQQIQALTGAQVSATSSGAGTASVSQPAPANSSECPSLSRTLSYGANGADVANLQAYLAAQQDFTGSPTGYFGSVTQAAVGQWQVAHGVVAAGDTIGGLGIVGPRTLAAIASACGGPAPAASCIPTEPPSAECSTGWQPVTDAAGCTTYYQCTVALPTAQASASTSVQSAGTASCPVVAQPSCSGQVVPFQTNSNGCVTSYECVL